MWQYKYLAILESARDFTQMEWLMAQPPDACQRPSWRCYINQHSLSLPPSSSPSRSRSIFHTASSALRLLPSLSSRCRSALCGSANLLHCWISIIHCAVSMEVRQAKSEKNKLTGRKPGIDMLQHKPVYYLKLFNNYFSWNSADCRVTSSCTECSQNFLWKLCV